MTLPAFLATPLAKGIAVSLVALVLIGGTAWVLRSEFAKGQKAGAADATSTVQQETIKAQENARREKEQIDEKVRSTPYDDRVDGLR